MCETKCDTTDVCGPTMAITSSFSKFIAGTQKPTKNCQSHNVLTSSFSMFMAGTQIPYKKKSVN
jgi:hypothetical protein